MLLAGDRRSIGRVAEIIEYVWQDSRRIDAVVTHLWDENANVRMRAADVLEKISRDRAGLLQAHKAELLMLLAETAQQEVRWHLAVMVPRLRLTAPECLQISDRLQSYLEDTSSIVKTFAMQGLADLTDQNASLRPAALDLLRSLTRTGTPAMRARGRKLLEKLEHKDS